MNNYMNIYAGEEIAHYGFPNGHPFSRQRFDAFWNAFIKKNLINHDEIGVQTPVLATDDDIALFHTQVYIEQVKQQSTTGEGYLDFGDTPAYPGVYEDAKFVVGTVLQAANDILNNKCQSAFVPIAGLHHARRDQASGFCVFNDCGIVIEHLLTKLKTVAYVDIDAHHGDGVYYGFEDNPNVIFADLHEDGRYLFPGTGDSSETGLGNAKGRKLNIPMPMHADDAMFYNQFDNALAFVAEFKPEFIILQCGVDSINGDPITHLQYSTKAHHYAANKLKKLTSQLGQNRLLCLGGGGYNLDNIANGWCAIVEGLLSD